MTEQNITYSRREEPSEQTPDPKQTFTSEKKRRIRLISIALIVMGIVSYLVFTGMQDSMAYYLTISELASQSSQMAERGLRIGGRVREGSLVWEPKTLQLEFMITDEEASMPVVYQGVLPDSFKQGTEVIVEGVYADGVFKATQIMPTCPSKYEAS
ncbi:MAG: cytochrome c maturation protein CcmE [bacterium]|nr:cytochrome c maturation protein CcmE [bacterium]